MGLSTNSIYVKRHDTKRQAKQFLLKFYLDDPEEAFITDFLQHKVKEKSLKPYLMRLIREDVLLENKLVSILDEICVSLCISKETSEIKIDPESLWEVAQAKIPITKEAIEQKFLGVIKAYCSLMFCSDINGQNFSCEMVETYTINGKTDELFDKVEFVEISLNKEYLEYHQKKNDHKT